MICPKCKGEESDVEIVMHYKEGSQEVCCSYRCVDCNTAWSYD